MEMQQISASPWRTTWFSPRATIRRIVDTEMPPSWWPAVALASIVAASMSLGFDADGSVSASRSFMPVCLAILQTIGPVLVGPYIYAFVGERLGGQADPSEIRPAVAWALVPLAVLGLCWIPVALMHGDATDPSIEVPLHIGLLMFIVSVGFIWSLVAQVIMLAEVHRFAVWRAIATMAIIMVPFLLLGAF